jgi:hypothetical protein
LFFRRSRLLRPIIPAAAQALAKAALGVAKGPQFAFIVTGGRFERMCGLLDGAQLAEQGLGFLDQQSFPALRP